MDAKKLRNSTKNLHLLYVEDDEKVRESSLQLFENFFDRITVATNGEDGLAKFNNERADLIITDISMPIMDGLEMVRQIRKQVPKIPVIVFSALINDPSNIINCISLNIDGFILKPLQTDNFIEALEKAVRKIEYHTLDTPYDIAKRARNIADDIQSDFNIDELTGLQSHNALMSSLENTSVQLQPVAILININAFRIYNEIYGLEIGDRILKAFSVQLLEVIKNMPYELYRMSGDEFVLFETVSMLDLDRYVDDIETIFHYFEMNPIQLDQINEPIFLELTVGMAFGHDNLYGRADMAVQEARKRGRKFLGFTADADRRKELENNLYWRHEINRALDEERVHAYYQPIVDRQGNILKYESLMRIIQIKEDGTKIPISPYQFLDLSKVTRQYVNLTKVVIKEAFDMMIEKNVHIAINLTFHDVANNDISMMLKEHLNHFNMASRLKFDISSQVIFELLEQPNQENYHRFVDFIDEFKEQGVLIAIDNFGLGFSSMSEVSALAPHYFKIDSSLIKNIDRDKHSFRLVKAIVQFAKELGVQTIAEHVSSKEIFEACVALDIDEFQGFYFYEPLESI